LNDHLFAVIMAGGIGSRLWPRSRGATPKQFLDLLGTRTMLQETVDRIEPLIPPERVLIVTGQEYMATVLEQVPALPPENVVVEPAPRGTAPCIGLAAVAMQRRDPKGIMAVFPADHRIADAAGFRRAIAAAGEVAQDGYLVTLGITPTHPQTGYGYIQRGDPLGHVQDQPAYRVERFTEKPDASTARHFVASGEYYWNAGIFIWQAHSILAEMERLLPGLYEELQAIAAEWDRDGRSGAIAAVDIGWDDVGNWATLSALLDRDGAGNVLRGHGRHLAIDTEDTYIYASTGRLVAAVGLAGFVVVDTPDALLVCPKERAQAVRDAVDRLKADGLDEYL
jgi:mannose-1-phosphate guanylyltransferase